MKQTDWDAAIIELQERATGEDAPEESNPMFKLKEIMINFCFKSRRSEDRTQIDRKPFVDTKKKMVHFTFDNLFTHLTDEKKWKFSEENTHLFLKKMGGVTRDKLHIQGNIKRNVYSVSSTNFEEEKLVRDKIEFSNEKKENF